ncbi:MAG: TIGR00730 family Rossman fold protein [Burkholderiales bacterium]
MKSICLFAGASNGQDSAYAEAARETGHLLAARGITLVFGGGRRGLMGTAADAALAAGGRVIGVIPASLQRREQSYAEIALTKLHVVRSMHERKAMMAHLADGFLALPGGFGTLEELCEMTTWTQLGIHAKAVVLVNVRNYFDSLLTMFDRATSDGFLDAAHRGIVLSAPTPAAALSTMERFAPPTVAPWIDLEEA